MQHSLFTDQQDVSPTVEGLRHIASYISKAEEAKLIEYIDTQPWQHDLKRRVQHYGYRYDYKARRVTPDFKIGPLPDWIMTVGRKLADEGLMSGVPDQAIANEYLPGQGISPHIDCVPCFGNEIVSLSLGSSCVMDFSNADAGHKASILLQPCDLIVLSGPARYQWLHGIAGRKTDHVNGVTIHRQRRLSLTFRKVILADAT